MTKIESPRPPPKTPVLGGWFLILATDNLGFVSSGELKTVEKYPEHDAFMSQTPQKHLEQKFFLVILTTKIHFFDLQNFLDFAQLDRKKVTPQPSRALENFLGTQHI